MAQVDCANIGFEQGAMTGWIMSYGTVTDANMKVVFQGETTGTRNNEHYVTSATDGNDPKVSSISMVAPGSTHSLRLGNTTTGTHFSRIKTEYLVTEDNTLFQYQFAVLLQNTSGNSQNHESYQKPGFNIEIKDSNGDILPCSQYDIQLQGTNTVTGFLSSGDIQYRPWTTGAIDLRNYIGKKITIMVTAHGCTQKGHFGYAYFDAQCVKSEIRPVSICPDDDGYMTLKAPDGFGTYTWNNGETGATIRVKANLGDKYKVKLTPLASLDASCSFDLDYTITYKKTTAELVKEICEGEVVAVGDTIYKTTGTFIRNISKSNVCDSTVTLKLTVNKVPFYTQDVEICLGQKLTVGDTTFATSGTFIRKIRLKTGCDSTVTTHLTVREMTLQTTADLVITQGDSTELEATINPSGAYQFLWRNSSSLSCLTCDHVWVKPDKTEVYTIDVSDVNNICKKEGKITVSVKPCGIDAPDAFSPNGDGKNDVFFVNTPSCITKILDMKIYNRWGEVVYSNQNFQGSDEKQGWSGMYHGEISTAGVYPYKISVAMKSGRELQYNGVVHLLR